MRRQADLAYLVQLVRGDERQHQTQKYEQNGGRGAHPVSQDVAHQNGCRDRYDDFEHVVSFGVR